VLDYEALARRLDAPPGSSWGMFPADPERGAANFAGKAEVRAAASSIVTGETFSLDYALNAFDPPVSSTRASPIHEITSHRQSRDDVVRELHLQASSQLDGLRHRRASGWGFYGGMSDARIVPGDPGIGIQRWAEKPIVGRGILIDVGRVRRRRGAPVDHSRGEALPVSLLDAALAAQGVEFRRGDIALVRTGWAEWYLSRDAEQRALIRAEGRFTGFVQSEDLLRWVWDRGAAAFASDTVAVEVLPPIADSPFLATAPEDGGMMHQALIAKLGVPLGELWNLETLSAHSAESGRWDAFVTVKPLHLVGGVGSPPNATAIR
jgi:kynurenine formamidase